MLKSHFSKEGTAFLRTNKVFLERWCFFQKNDSFKTINDLKSSKQIFYLINEFSKRY